MKNFVPVRRKNSNDRAWTSPFHYMDTEYPVHLDCTPLRAMKLISCNVTIATDILFSFYRIGNLRRAEDYIAIDQVPK